MKALKVFFTVSLITGLCLAEVNLSWSETRTLTTVIRITVKAEQPTMEGLPPVVAKALRSPYTDSAREQFVKLDNGILRGQGAPRYTMMEKL